MKNEEAQRLKESKTQGRERKVAICYEKWGCAQRRSFLDYVWLIYICIFFLWRKPRTPFAPLAASLIQNVVPNLISTSSSYLLDGHSHSDAFWANPSIPHSSSVCLAFETSRWVRKGPDIAIMIGRRRYAIGWTSNSWDIWRDVIISIANYRTKRLLLGAESHLPSAHLQALLYPIHVTGIICWWCLCWTWAGAYPF